MVEPSAGPRLISPISVCRAVARRTEPATLVMRAVTSAAAFLLGGQKMMNLRKSLGMLGSTFLAGLSWSGLAQSEAAKTAYPQMAPVEQYRMASREDEIALARSAAPPSISAEAEVLVLGSRGYETAVKGKNGFVCFVERSWAAGFDDPQFWNPKLRAPNCFNPPAARTELTQYLKRTEWVLTGATKQQMIERTTAAVADHTF